MNLVKMTDRVFYYPHQPDKDRPNIGYIKGDNYSVAIDAGHSFAHIKEFYNALTEDGFPLPSVTILTHWHWDHSFATHAINGLSIANSRTNQHLIEFKERIEKEGTDFFFNIHETIRNEYGNNEPIIIVPADIVFDNELFIDAGNCPIKLMRTKSPHTDDSTLIQVVNERILFLGDSTCGDFPSGIKDRTLCEEYVATISSIDVDVCLEGHWDPDTPQGIIDDVLNS